MRLASVREVERARISREIHDDLGQVLARFKMDTAWLLRHLTGAEVPIIEKIETMNGDSDRMIETVQRICLELRPRALDDLGLLPAIESELRQFEARTGVMCVFTSKPADLQVDQERATALFRILQEVLSNVARHAGATTVRVRLSDRKGRLSFGVLDNGRGIDPAKAKHPNSIGLLGIRERAAVFKGEVSVRGKPGRGTLVLVQFPKAQL